MFGEVGEVYERKTIGGEDLNRDRMLGISILVASVAGVLVYGWLLFFSQWGILALQLTGFIAIAAVSAIVAWIGYTMATTMPPKPIQEIELEKTEKEKA